MTKDELIESLLPFFAGFGATVSDAVWQEYYLALGDVNPGDLDDAMADLRKTHAFRNAPLPAEILTRCDAHRRARQADQPTATPRKALPTEGEWVTFAPKTGPLVGLSMKFHVLPDEHPSLPRYACVRCLDTSWEEIPRASDNPGQPVMRRCACWQSNPVIARHRAQDAEHRRGRKTA